ncbi:ferritin [Geosporobacter subterraneus DSM 17957]|uniref:Ferritin n=1 Tax=Geosporobacter subterraneus DSM 17957 TaxID=1121919 RepID=A0A1M6INJ3_9FIRM|nr:ferritin [Geosporobacter subterraneus]SHJ36016.1 ferritin [Geosporobacter subterraneus DSM 17957]
MISEKLFAELNDQVKYELFSSNLYLAMAAYCASEDLNGFANFFRVQAEEEKFHAMKFFDYIIERNGRVTISALDQPENQYTSMLDAFQKGYVHEQFVTKRIYDLMDIAMDEREHATISFLKWFIDEQVEEESTFNGIIKKLERIGNDTNALYMLDAELAQRVFTPPADANQ